MNIDRLIAVARELREVERELGTQEKLTAVKEALDHITSDPSEPSYQQALVDNLKELRTSTRNVSRRFTPTKQKIVDKLVNGNEFSTALYTDVKTAIDQNGLTPSVARDAVQKILDLRERTLSNLAALVSAHEFFGWEEESAGKDGAILEFTIPRDIFENQFSSLVRELDFLKRIVALVAESVDEDTDAELVSLSTTDPSIALLVAIAVATTFGRIVSWGVEVWKQVEEIRNLRSQTKRAGLHSPEEIAEFFDKKIDELLKAAIDHEAKRLTEFMPDRGRASEIENGFQIYLKPLLARLERGLTVDIRLIEDKGASSDDTSPVTELREVSRQLSFPERALEPILSLSAPKEIKIPQKGRRRSVKPVASAKPNDDATDAVVPIDPEDDPPLS